MTGNLKLDENSPSVQAHLEILQGVINRMATNSSSCKAWCVSLVSAVLVLVGDKGKPGLLWIAVIPTFLFFFLDAYYLALEQGFRGSYRTFVTKLHRGDLDAESLYEVRPESGSALYDIITAAWSLSIWTFYGTLLTMALLTGYVVDAVQNGAR